MLDEQESGSPDGPLFDQKDYKMFTGDSVLVIGAGLGGISTAARLARSGYQVTVLEKNSSPGGRCGQFVRDGHRFDIGATLFLMPEVFATTYADLGERMEEHLDLRRVDPTYRIGFDDGTMLSLTSDMLSLREQLEAIEPGSFGGLLRYLDEGRRHYQGSLAHFVGRNFIHLAEYFSPRNLPLLFQLKPLAKHYNNIGNYFDDPRLKAAFTFQNMYLGLSPFDAPATYSLLQYSELADGVWYPIGGLYRVVESLVAIAKDKGVRFHYNQPVEEILIENDRATGVRLVDGSNLAADIIIANADLPYVYNHLLPKNKEGERLEGKKYTCSAIMFYWGVDRLYPQLATHNIFLNGDYRASFDQIFEEKTLPGQPSIYIHAPCRIDPAAAPEGQDTLIVLVPVGHLDQDNPQDWTALRDLARTAVFNSLADIGIHDLEGHLKFEVSYSPQDWADQLNLAKGSAFGLSHNFWQVGYFRPQNRHGRYHNLYFTGSSTHPGAGLPMALLSGQLTTERVLQEMGQNRPLLTPYPAPA